MKASMVYLLAARAMAERKHCRVYECGFPCCAIEKVGDNDVQIVNLRGEFAELFYEVSWKSYATVAEQDIGVMALCLMSAIAAYEETHK